MNYLRIKQRYETIDIFFFKYFWFLGSRSYLFWFFLYFEWNSTNNFAICLIRFPTACLNFNTQEIPTFINKSSQYYQLKSVFIFLRFVEDLTKSGFTLYHYLRLEMPNASKNPLKCNILKFKICIFLFSKWKIFSLFLEMNEFHAINEFYWIVKTSSIEWQ